MRYKKLRVRVEACNVKELGPVKANLITQIPLHACDSPQIVLSLTVRTAGGKKRTAGEGDISISDLVIRRETELLKSV